jgi:hypothetical protein
MSAEPPAVLEPLDSDPRPPPSGLPWERWIGLLLVLGLVGFGLFTWWTDSTQQSAYRAGLHAETDHDWDAALAAFGRAGDYADAKTRAGNAATFAQQRNSAYSAATAAYARQDWTALIPALDQLKRTAPAYRDTPRLIEALETEVYTAALSGTVALRPTAAPPGWYAYRPGGWRYLAGSDAQSHILAHCPDGGWVLDVPILNSEGTPAPATFQTLRQLAVAAPDGTIRARLAFHLGDRDGVLCQGGRVWQLQSAAERLPRMGDDIYPIFAYTAAYQTIGQPDVGQPVFPPGHWYVLDVLPPDGLLALQLDDLEHPGPLHLYQTAFDGSQPRLLGSYEASPSIQTTSPDARWLLITLHSTVPPVAPTVDPPRQTQLLLADLTSAQPPQLLTTSLAPPSYNPNGPLLFSQFVTRGPYRGQITILEADGSREQVRLLDPARPAGERKFVLPQRLYEGYAALPTPDGGLFLSGLLQPVAYENPTLVRPVTATLLYFDAQGTPRTIDLPSFSDRRIEPLRVQEDRAIYLDAVNGYEANQTITFRVYSVPFADFGSAPATPTLLAAGGAQTDSRYGFPAPFWLGEERLAYVTPDGDLHTRRYDGSGDVLLGHGFSGFIPWWWADAAAP